MVAQAVCSWLLLSGRFAAFLLSIQASAVERMVGLEIGVRNLWRSERYQTARHQHLATSRPSPKGRNHVLADLCLLLQVYLHPLRHELHG